MGNQPVNILLVEDNQVDAMAVMHHLGKSHTPNTVTHVLTAGDAWDYLYKRGKYEDATTPGLILLDLNFPGGNGFEVLEQMNLETGLRDIPVCILTSSEEEEEDILHAYDSHAVAFISKPVSPQALAGVLKDI